jgi:hypothetical protein
MIRYRALLIAAGYPDGNDGDALKTDPAFKRRSGGCPMLNELEVPNVEVPHTLSGIASVKTWDDAWSDGQVEHKVSQLASRSARRPTRPPPAIWFQMLWGRTLPARIVQIGRRPQPDRGARHHAVLRLKAAGVSGNERCCPCCGPSLIDFGAGLS